MQVDRSRINALMDRASSGDGDVFGALALVVQDELFRFALANGLRRDAAAETTQETLARAYAGRFEWKPGSDAMGWLCGIALNVIREYGRRERRRADGGSFDWDGLADEGAVSTVAEEAETVLTPSRHLSDAIARLPPRQREAIACRYLREMSIRETAEAMDCAEGTVKSAVSAALERLRLMLQRRS